MKDPLAPGYLGSGGRAIAIIVDAASTGA